MTITPRYAETDQGGMVHHSVYPVWFEMGRTELLRANNVTYRDIEQAGVFFVVAELLVRYRLPARYDEELLLNTSCASVNAGTIEHTYELVRRQDGAVVAEGSTTLACVDRDGRARRIPRFIRLGP